MKLVDSNVWLALVVGTHLHHAAASDWFERQTPNKEVVFCRATQLSFLRLLTTRSIQNHYNRQPPTNEEAYEFCLDLLADPRIGFVQEPPAVDAQLRRLGSVATSSPKLWMDAYLAAFAISGRHQFVTIDKGFKQFHGLDLLLLSG